MISGYAAPLIMRRITLSRPAYRAASSSHTSGKRPESWPAASMMAEESPNCGLTDCQMSRQSSFPSSLSASFLENSRPGPRELRRASEMGRPARVSEASWEYQAEAVRGSMQAE